MFNISLCESLLARSAPCANGCREWLGASGGSGHGQTSVNGKRLGAHVAMYEAVHGPIPAGMEVRHSCDNPPCIAIEHLLLGTHADNMRDMRERGRHRWGERPRGAAHHNSKLTEADVLAIRSDPQGCDRLARAYGVTPTTIRHIRNRRTWNWLP
jgi:hypothetical protein